MIVFCKLKLLTPKESFSVHEEIHRVLIQVPKDSVSKIQFPMIAELAGEGGTRRSGPSFFFYFP